ncbi:MAG: hypothetical protein V5B36_14260 [Candidatus Accumulibacter sp. UW25]|jgi:hypothetical protein
MTFARAAFLAFLLLFAQSAAFLHSLEHLQPAADEAGEPVCTFCLAAQALDAPLPMLARALPEPLPPPAPPAGTSDDRRSPQRPSACARAPPSA